MMDKAIVSVISMVFLLILSLSVLSMLLAFVEKNDFDQVCRNALYEMDLDGGLSGEKRQELEDLLELSGYSDIWIEAPDEVQYGEWIPLKVSATFQMTILKNMFQNEEGMLYFSYNQKIISRRIHNEAY